MPLEKFGPSRRQHAELGEGIKVQEMTRALQSIYSEKAAGGFQHAQKISAFSGKKERLAYGNQAKCPRWISRAFD